MSEMSQIAVTESFLDCVYVSELDYLATFFEMDNKKYILKKEIVSFLLNERKFNLFTFDWYKIAKRRFLFIFSHLPAELLTLILAHHKILVYPLNELPRRETYSKILWKHFQYKHKKQVYLKILAHHKIDLGNDLVNLILAHIKHSLS